MIQYFAITLAWAGESDLALQQLELGLRAPSASAALSYGALKLHPFWDALRGDPRFEVLGPIHSLLLLKLMSMIKPITIAENPINTNKPLRVSNPHPLSKHTPPVITSIQAIPFSIFN